MSGQIKISIFKREIAFTVKGLIAGIGTLISVGVFAYGLVLKHDANVIKKNNDRITQVNDHSIVVYLQAKETPIR